MAVTVGNAAYGAYKGAALRFMLAGAFAGYLATLVIVGGAWMLGRSPVLVSVIGLLIVSAETWYFRSMFADIRDTYREGHNWLKGAQGERLVHGELTKLSDDYIVFNDFHPAHPTGGVAPWNVDHIVIGPTGVFVIDTKNYSSQVVGSARHDRRTKKNVRQVSRNAFELKKGIVAWSAGALEALFVVPVVVYAQEGVHVEALREGNTRVLPLRMLLNEVQRHTETAIDLDKAHRIARVLYNQMPIGDRAPFEPDLRAYGARALADRASRKAAVSPQPAAHEPSRDQAGTCPRCSGKLVVRVAGRGARKGARFLGCSAFPKCRHTEPLPPIDGLSGSVSAAG